VLKQPLETAIAIHTEDFEDFHMQENVHIVINVKDFKAIVTHAETLRGSITAYFSSPNRPLQFSYGSSGMHCEFTLMTSGDQRGASSTPTPRFVSTRPNGISSRQPSAVPAQGNHRVAAEMPPPARLSAARSSSSQIPHPTPREQVQPARTSTEDPDPESLFVPRGDGDEDETWDTPNYQQDDDEMLGWDVSNENFSASIRPTIRDLSKSQQPSGADRDLAQARTMSSHGSDILGLQPTQRLSQVCMMAVPVML
jgi:cell cycle checkpoint control protein RAD9A